MTDDATNGIPPPPVFPPAGVTIEQIEQIIARLALPGNVVANTETLMFEIMRRLDEVERKQGASEVQFKTFATVWADSIDTRKQQLDRIESDLADDSDKIKIIDDKLETAINFQVSNDELIRQMKNHYDRDLYGGTVKDGDTIIPGLVSTVKFMNDAIMKLSETVRVIVGRLEKEEELTARVKRRNELIAQGAIKAIPLVVKFFAVGGFGTTIAAITAMILKILGG